MWRGWGVVRQHHAAIVVVPLVPLVCLRRIPRTVVPAHATAAGGPISSTAMRGQEPDGRRLTGKGGGRGQPPPRRAQQLNSRSVHRDLLGLLECHAQKELDRKEQEIPERCHGQLTAGVFPPRNCSPALPRNWMPTAPSRALLNSHSPGPECIKKSAYVGLSERLS